MSAIITGCVVAIVVFCAIYPPAAWPIVAVLATVIAFAGDSHA